MATTKDIYEEITARVIEQLEKGIIPWHKPWFGGSEGAISGATGKPYSLINQLHLGTPGRYYTFNQVQHLEAHIRKGEKSRKVVFWKQHPISETDKTTGETKTKYIPVLKYFCVFHESQIEGLPTVEEQPNIAHIDPHEEAEAIVTQYITASGVTLNRDQLSGQAFYRPSDDSITVPRLDQFAQQAEYYSTLFHEMVHSTGHSSRLNRISSTAHFGNEEYSKEELVAEIGAAALVNRCGIETESSTRNTTAYLQGWLSKLRSDKKFLVNAAGKAEKAVHLILTGEVKSYDR